MVCEQVIPHLRGQGRLSTDFMVAPFFFFEDNPKTPATFIKGFKAPVAGWVLDGKLMCDKLLLQLPGMAYPLPPKHLCVLNISSPPSLP